MLLLDHLEGVREMSNFPPHMVDAKGRLLPSSFIPFCTYQTNLLGLTNKDRKDLPFTACSQAQPTVLHGQLCYSINISDIAGNNTTKMGKSNGLLLLLDIGTETLTTEKSEAEQEVTPETKSFEKDKSNEHKTSAKVHVHTLSEFSNYGGSSFYTMSALKSMVASNSFMEFPNHVKKCQVEELEKCRISNFFKMVQEQCQCIPWQLATFNDTGFNMTSKVSQHTKCAALPVFRRLPAAWSRRRVWRRCPRTRRAAWSPVQDCMQTFCMPMTTSSSQAIQNRGVLSSLPIFLLSTRSIKTALQRAWFLTPHQTASVSVLES